MQGEKVLDLVDQFIDDARQSAEIITQARRLVRQVWNQKEMLDQALGRHARNWQLGRLALVDRNILRLAAFEMFEARVPPKVAITEAMALGREFSTAESPRFINGVCDAIAREIHEQTRRD